MNADTARFIQKMRLFILLAALFTLASSPPAFSGIQDKIERGLGSQVAREIEAETGVVDDPVLSRWVSGIGKELADGQGGEDVRFSFKILDSEDVNAMAVPGGYVYVTKGLLRFAQSEDEIASVLGHEVGHVTAKHSMEQLKVQILGSLVLSAFKNKKYSTALGGARLAGLFAMLKWSRDNEKEADVLGVQGAAAAGYDPRRMMDFFNRMNEKDKTKTSRWESYLLTHPPFAERIQTISKRPEMQESGQNFLRTATGYANRKLYSQAREAYNDSLVRAPGLPDAIKGLKDLPPANLLPETGTFKSSVEITIPEDRVSAAGDRLKALDKRQAGLQKQLKSVISNLNFAGNMISEYDYTSIREFQLAADAVVKAAKIHAIATNANASAKSSTEELSSLAKRLSNYGPQADALRVRFPAVTEQVLASLESNLPKVEESLKRTEQSCRSVEFAVRQLVSTLMMPRTTEIGAAGVIETQLQMARKSINSELLGIRDVVMNLEASRSVLLQTRVNLQTCSVGDQTKRSYAELAAGYIGTNAEAVMGASPDVGTAFIRAYQAAVERPASDASKAKKAALNYDNANILLNLLSLDIEREQKAYQQAKGKK